VGVVLSGSEGRDDLAARWGTGVAAISFTIPGSRRQLQEAGDVLRRDLHPQGRPKVVEAEHAQVSLKSPSVGGSTIASIPAVLDRPINVVIAPSPAGRRIRAEAQVLPALSGFCGRLRRAPLRRNRGS
jgi:hypothetical protein